MTDEENQRQRHLAEMMIAQCDGKALQIRNTSEQPWRRLNGSLCDLNPTTEIRIEPEPREWWICETCNLRRAHLLKSPHFPYQGNTACTGNIAHVREVLGDD